MTYVAQKDPFGKNIDELCLSDAYFWLYSLCGRNTKVAQFLFVCFSYAFTLVREMCLTSAERVWAWRSVLKTEESRFYSGQEKRTKSEKVVLDLITSIQTSAVQEGFAGAFGLAEI